MLHGLDLVAIGLALAGIILIVCVWRARLIRDKRRGAYGERRSRRAVRRHVHGAKTATSRILAGPEGSTGVDLVVATPTAVYLVETKYRNCREIRGGTNDPKWLAIYGPGPKRRYQFQNPLQQADRQARAVRALLATAGVDCPVYRSVVILGANRVPQHVGVFSQAPAIAQWIARHSRSRDRPNNAGQPELPEPPGWMAFDSIMAHSKTGFRAMVRHVWQIGARRNAVAYAWYGVVTVAGVSCIAIAMALHGVAAIHSLGDTRIPAPHEVEAPASRPSPEPASTPAPEPTAVRATASSDKCTDLATAQLLSHQSEPLHFVRTGPKGRLQRRGSLTVGMVISALTAAARNRRVESIVFATPSQLLATGLSFETDDVWLPCSPDGARPLGYAIQGRVVPPLAASPPYQTAMNALAVRFDRLPTPVSGTHVRIDWVASVPNR